MDAEQAMPERSLDEPAGAVRWFDEVADQLLELDRPVPLFEVAQEFGELSKLSMATLRRLVASLRAQGYLHRALAAADELAGRDGAQQTLRENLRAELAVLSGEVALKQSPPDRGYSARPRRVLSVVGTTLLDVDSSYTRRTHEFALQAAEMGLDVSVASQMGVGASSTYEIEEVDGVAYHRIPGPTRGSVPFDEWLELFAARLSSVVRKVRPSVLVASSDFVNGLAAEAVRGSYGIPFVYDVRGLWHDSWLDRQRAKYSWTEDQVPGRWGAPDTWALRQDREVAVARGADAVVATSGPARDRLVSLGVDAGPMFEIADPVRDAAKWIPLLKRIGVLASDEAEVTHAALTPPLIDGVRESILKAERKPLDRIAGVGGFGTVRSIRDEGWRHSSLDPIKLDTPFDWAGACRDNRSQAFHLHAWDFMVPFLKNWDRSRDPESLAWCLERATDWAATFNHGSGRETMAWYDMAIGLRAPRLAYLLQEAVHEGEPDRTIDLLINAVARHQRELYAEAAFNPRTNHGFYTAVGQLSFARRLLAMPAMEILERQGRERLKVVVATQFGADGGHLEHSPDYHRMLLSSFRDAMEDGLLQDPEVADRISRAADVMGWFIQPNRRIVQIGDSPARLVSPDDRALKAPTTQFLASEGRAGEPNVNELCLLPDSGYAFVRSPQPRAQDDHRRSGYLTFMGGFHSRAHKHCDDLSITWFDSEQEVLIDSGRFGYLDPLPIDSPDRKKGFFYGRPERQYVEGVRAHNTVQMDDQDHDRRDRRPYGSAIKSGEQKEGFFRLSGHVDHGSWLHSRTLTYLPSNWLLVEDEVAPQDEKEHEFTVWWNFAAALREPTVGGAAVRFQLQSGERHLHVVSLSGDSLVAPVKGEDRPLRGWRAAVDYEFTPIWSMAHRATTSTSHRFVTLLTLDEHQQSRPRTPFDA